MANRSLQLLRNNTLFSTLAEAKAAMSANTVTTQDGVAVLGRYGSGDNIKTVLGIKHAMNGGTGMTFFENSNETSELIQKLQQELDATQEGAGLSSGGTFEGPSDGTWTTGATTLAEAIDKLEKGLESISAGTVSGDSKVVIDVTQDKGKITATSANLTGVKLDGYAEGTDADIAATDTLGEALGKLQAQINAMDLTAVGTEGSVITSVSEEDGKVSATTTPIKDVKLTGYVKDTTKTGDIAATDDIEDALSKLENKAAAITITNDDGSINVTTGANGTNINVNIKSGENVIKLDGEGGGLYTNLNLVKITESLPATVKERYEFRDSDNAKIGESIDIAKDSHIVSITYITNTGDTHYQNLEYVYIDASGNTQTVYVDMNSLILEAEFASGITVTDGIAHGVVDPTSEKNSGETASFLTVGENGFKVDGIKQEIINRINELDVTDTAADGQYVSAVNETDGKVAISRANVSDAVLNGYAKGEKPASTAIAATDDVKGAIAKLEHQIDDAKAAATTKVVEGTDAGNNLEIVPTTGADQSVTYTINLTDVASNSALTEEIAARKAVDGQTGQTYAANAGVNYIGAATDLNDADVKLDAALKALDDKAITTITSSNGSISAISSTNSYDLVTDTSKIKLSSFTESSSSAETAPQDGQTLNEALAAIYATAKHHHLTASNEGVTVATTTDGTTVGLNLDQASTAPDDREDGAYVHTPSNNVLSIDSEGLYLSNVWDCGTY